MNSQKVSIIIPCYNYGKYVKDAIDSALNQTYTNIEIVIINDGSTDSSADVIKPYLSTSKIVYLEQQNGGPVVSRNNGIAASSGDWIYPLDADDYISPKFIQEAFRSIVDYKTIVSTHVHEADAALNLTGNVWYIAGGNSDLIRQRNSLNGNSLFSKKFFNEVGGYNVDLSRLGWEDWDLWIRMIDAGANIKIIKSSDDKQPYFRYRKHGTSRSSTADNNQSLKQYFIKKYNCKL